MEEAGAFQAISTSVGCSPPSAVAAVAFAVARVAIAWLLQFIAHHKITVFIWYRIANLSR